MSITSPIRTSRRQAAPLALQTSVVVLSPHELTRAGLTILLADVPGVRVHPAGYLAAVKQGRQAAPTWPRIVVLFDLAGLQRNKTEMLVRLVAHTSMVVLALTDDLCPEQTDLALNLGVDGCIPMSAPAADLIAAVRGTSADRRLHPAPRDDSVWTLSPREIDVLLLIGRGCSNVEVADELFLSVNTVKTYIRSAYRKIGVTSRSQAVGWCVINRIGHLARHRSESSPQLEC